jgi:hypothetical protein
MSNKKWAYYNDNDPSPALTENTGVLNPDLPRWLMGFRAEWIYCGVMAMQSFRK